MISKSILQCELYKEPFSASVMVYEYVCDYLNSEECQPEFRRRSHLFVPLNKINYLEKIGRGEVAADGFIWDLEDSVPMSQKKRAREAIAHLPKKPGFVEYNVRINCGDPQELPHDLKAIAGIPLDSITLPKGESATDILQLMRHIGEDKDYIVTIETLKGLNNIEQIASILRPRRDALGFGVGDMTAELEIERVSTCENVLLQQILGTIAIVGKRYNLELFDSVSARFNDPENAYKEGLLSRHTFGYTGKKLINPKQLDAINTVFAPSQSMITQHLSILESFLHGAETNAHVVGGEYKGMPAFKSAERFIKKILRQGYLVPVEP